MSQYLILLAIIPLSCISLTKIYDAKDRWMLIGLSIGLVIAPLSFGLLQFTYVPVIGKLVGYLGLLIHLTHGSIGYFCLAGSGIFEPGAILAAPQLMLLALVNGLIFASWYGLLGHFIDRKIEEESANVAWE